MSSNTVSDTMKTVSIARNIKRPTAREFIDQLFDDLRCINRDTDTRHDHGSCHQYRKQLLTTFSSHPSPPI